MTKEELLYAAEVMKAAAEGKEVEVAYKNCDHYGLVDEPIWDWKRFTYRIKSQPKYRPFNNAEEVFEAIKEHGTILKGRASYVLLQEWGPSCMWVSAASDGTSYDIAINRFTFADGTPFGKLEE